MEKLKAEIEWFLSNTGHKGFPFIRFYLRVSIQEARNAGYSEDQINEVIREQVEIVARKLHLDSWID